MSEDEEENKNDDHNRDVLNILEDAEKEYYSESNYNSLITTGIETLIEPDLTEIFETDKEEDSFLKLLKSTDNALKTHYGIEMESSGIELELYNIGKGKNTLTSLIEVYKPTEIVDEKTDLKTLSLTNKKLVEENIKLTKKFVELNENYEKLVEETNFSISKLEKRITELINSKISVSSVPDYWFEEDINEQKEENSDPLL